MPDPYTYPVAAKRRKPIALIVGGGLVATAATTVVGVLRMRGWGGVTDASFQAAPSLRAVGTAIGNGLFDSTLNPGYWAFVVFLTIVQWRWPARPEQRALSVDLAIDAVWFVTGNAQAHRVHHAVEPPVLRAQLRHRVPLVGLPGPHLLPGGGRVPRHGDHRHGLPPARAGGRQPAALGVALPEAARLPLPQRPLLWTAQVGATHAFGRAAMSRATSPEGGGRPGPPAGDDPGTAPRAQHGGRSRRLAGQNYYLDFLSAGTAYGNDRPAALPVESSIERLVPSSS